MIRKIFLFIIVIILIFGCNQKLKSSLFSHVHHENRYYALDDDQYHIQTCQVYEKKEYIQGIYRYQEELKKEYGDSDKALIGDCMIDFTFSGHPTEGETTLIKTQTFYLYFPNQNKWLFLLRKKIKI